jgi:hypothetical protein
MAEKRRLQRAGMRLVDLSRLLRRGHADAQEVLDLVAGWRALSRVRRTIRTLTHHRRTA